MSKSTALTPTVTVATAYYVTDQLLPIVQYNLPLQPACSQAGTQTVTPQPSPSA